MKKIKLIFIVQVLFFSFFIHVNYASGNIVELEKQISLIEKLRGDHTKKWSGILVKLADCFRGADVWLKSFSNDQTGRVSCNVVSVSSDLSSQTKEMTDFISKIKKSGIVENIWVSDYSMGKLYNKEILNFNLSFKLKKQLKASAFNGRIYKSEDYKTIKRSKLVKYLESISEVLKTDDELVVTMIKTLDLISTKSGLRLKDSRTSPMIMYEYYSEIPIEVSLEGTYQQLTAFVSNMENSEYFNINDATINITPRGIPRNNEQILNVSISLRKYIVSGQKSGKSEDSQHFVNKSEKVLSPFYPAVRKPIPVKRKHK